MAPCPIVSIAAEIYQFGEAVCFLTEDERVWQLWDPGAFGPFPRKQVRRSGTCSREATRLLQPMIDTSSREREVSNVLNWVDEYTANVCVAFIVKDLDVACSSYTNRRRAEASGWRDVQMTTTCSTIGDNSRSSIKPD